MTPERRKAVEALSAGFNSNSPEALDYVFGLAVDLLAYVKELEGRLISDKQHTGFLREGAECAGALIDELREERDEARGELVGFSKQVKREVDNARAKAFEEADKACVQVREQQAGGYAWHALEEVREAIRKAADLAPKIGIPSGCDCGSDRKAASNGST